MARNFATTSMLATWAPAEFFARGSNQEVWGSEAQGQSPGGVWAQKLTVYY